MKYKLTEHATEEMLVKEGFYSYWVEINARIRNTVIQ